MEFPGILCGITGILCAILTFYYFVKSTFDFWKSRGVRGPRPTLGPSNLKNILLSRIAAGNVNYLKETYDNYKDERLIGIFAGMTPILIVKEPDLIKDVLIKDFSVFAHRGLSTFEKTEPLSQHLFSLEPKRWRPLRMKLSPVFTSGKLKEMFSLMSECADNLVQYIDKVASKNEPVECRELTAKYTTDVIGSCAFGIQMNALSNEDSEFRRMGRKVFNPSKTHMLRIKIRESFPRLYNMLGNILPQIDFSEFFTRVIVETMDYRETNNITRNDFVDTLRELKKHPDKLGDINLTDGLLASQAFVFYIAGFETSSTTISHTLYELALNPKIQDKLREEIDEVYAKHGGNLIRDNIKEMDYLDKVFKETLRKYPPATFLMRQSTSSYTFDGTDVTIPMDQKVWIPIYAIHRDPSIYSKPDVFDPERFNEEAVQNRHPMVYLPFGDGPRNCIGSRFAIYQSKIGLIKILRNYKVETCEKTPIPYISNPRAFVLCPNSGIYLKIIKINRD
ncbi:PREDICTED: probable cytochrome P450 6a14 [Vollenhovia emeryi]|uniref:probable cytochrome P450 6a14 n=1 Tax=Vollenhovia emeryi TaxID=411798 RepID=UPI0005F4D46C|nr:PREDICTED: probable cytochrome P450 6a14 [Vollenhovia emeryi]